MMRAIKGFNYIIFCFLTIFVGVSNACTDFRLTATDGSILVSRSMEFAEDMHANLRTSLRGRSFATTAPDGKPGLAWTAKYGYIYLDGMNYNAAIDGMNEKGLSFEALFFPNFAQYQTVTADQDAKALPYINIGDWALSNFATVAELKAQITNVVVFAQQIAQFGTTIFPLHFSFFDASGDSLVVEYVNGQLTTFENKVGVFTNSPTFDWHVTNLNNYVNLTPINPNPVVVKGLTFVATGQGAGMLGLPGDISPPSRFIKTSVLKGVVIPAKNASDAVNLAEHIINNVDIPLGLAREPNSGNYTNEYTQWVIFKDLTNKIVYYRTYEDLSLRSVNIAGIDFSEKATSLKMPIAGPGKIEDMTADFIKMKAS